MQHFRIICVYNPGTNTGTGLIRIMESGLHIQKRGETEKPDE